MRMRVLPSHLVVCAVMAALLTPVLADEPGVTNLSADQVSRLEAIYEAQQQKIELLQQQVAAAELQDQDAARSEAMRQQIREILSEQEFRESLMPSVLQAGYDKGFFIKSSDEKFLMKINGRIQFRWTHYATRRDNRWQAARLQRNDRTGFDLQRLRLSFRGHAFDPNLTYRIELETGRANSYDARLYYGWVNYRLRDEFQITTGLFKIAGTRVQFMSDGVQQFVDRPMTDAVFHFGRGVGVRFWGHLFDKRLDYYLDVVNSLRGEANRTITPDRADTPTGTEMDSNPAIVFRTIWHALGDEPGDLLKSQPDLKHHQSPALDLGFHYAFNEDEGDLNTVTIPYPLPRRIANLGGFGVTNTWGTQINQFGVDAQFQWRGFSALGEYILRIVDPRRAGRVPFTNWWLFTNQGDTTVQHGAYVQVGYFLPIPGLENKLEVAARAGGISALANGQEGTWEYGASLNYYIEGHNVKLQTDVNKVTEVPVTSSSNSLANVNDDALIWRVQLQLAF